MTDGQADDRSIHELDAEVAVAAGSKATEIMLELQELWLSVAPGKSPEDFEAEVHALFDHDVSLSELEEDFGDSAHLSKRELGAWPLIEKPIRIAYGHAYAAALASAGKFTSIAWKSIGEASFWWGLAMGVARMPNENDDAPTITEIARKGADARNAENRALKEEAMLWLGENRDTCKSKDEAAEKLTKIVPVKFRTARRYVAEFDLSIP